MRRLRRAVAVGALAAAALAAAPAIASAATMTTAAATQIGSASATLNGQESGYTSSDYCSFIYWPSGQPSNWQQAYQAVPCSSSYVNTTDAVGSHASFSPDTQYSYAAIHCASTDFSSGYGRGCAPLSSGGLPWDAIDSCYTTNPASCPSFTTGSASGSVSDVKVVRVGVASAELTGSSTYSSGSRGSGNYCSFLTNVGSGWGPPTSPAVPCSSSYTITLTGFNSGQTAEYAAIHCAAVGGQPGGPYYCEANGSYANPNPYDVSDPCLSGATCPRFTTGTPTATTSAPSNVLGTSATLNGTLDIEDLTTNQSGISSSDVEYDVQYSTDQSFSAYTSTPYQYLPDANSFPSCPSGSTWPYCPPVSATVTGLQPGTTYYYRTVVLAPEAGDTTPSYGNVVSFTTGGRAITDPATGVGANSATLNGEVAAGDNALSYSWVYSASDTTQNGVLQGTTVTGGTVAAGQDQLLSTNLSGLLVGQTYYYQLVTNDPSIHGQVLSFTTAGAYCPSGAAIVTRSSVPVTGFVVSGCWGSANGVWTGYGPVTINGLSLPGPSTGKVAIDTAKHTLTASAGYTLAIGRLLIATGTAGLSFSYTNTSQGSQVNVIPDPSASWFGFPILSGVTITALPATDQTTPGGADVAVSVLGFPAIFGGITAQGSGTVNADGSLGGIEVQVGQSTLGPLTLPSFTFCYQSACPGASTSACQTGNESQSNTWFGDLEVYFPLAPVGVGGCAEIQNGRLNALGLSYSGPGIPLGATGVSISGLGASAIVNPLSFGGSIVLDFGPEVANTSLFSGSVGFNAAFNQDDTINGFSNVGIPDGTVLKNVPFALSLTGQLQLLGFITLANASAGFYDVPGSPLVTASFALGQPLTERCPDYLGGGTFGFVPSFSLAAAADANGFNAYGEGGLTLHACGVTLSLNANALISSKGMAACVAIPDPFTGGDYYAIGIYWPTTLPTSFGQLASLFQPFEPDQCDLSGYEANLVSIPASAARAIQRGAHAAVVGTLRLPGGLPFEVIRVRGRGAPPLLSVSGPRGLSIQMPTGQAWTHGRGYLAIADPLDDTTYIELTRPAAGAYHIAALPGSAGIAGIDAAHGLPAPSVRARITGAGARRTLTWRARPVAGQRLVFRELGGGGDRLLLSTTRSHGTLRYALRPGLSGRRYVVVQVLYGGMLQKVIRIGSYRGPVISIPRRPLRLAANRSGRRLTVTWREPGQRPSAYLVLVAYPDRARRLYIARAPRLLIHGVPAAGAIKVTVTAENALGRRGPSATATTTKPKRRHQPPKRRRQPRRTHHRR
ncbi:MAG TPA: fibronectin type III domain-containing protein [Solirubrobacteraceae bacterium]|nr:fibronectin type III domain-containing protein [Solirubrobacteraceae bacterium]